MTLVIALIANGIYDHLIGEPAISNLWIGVIWVGHLLYHSGRGGT